MIYTKRLYIRKLTLQDREFMYRMLNDPSWIRYIGDRQIFKLEDAERYLVDGPITMYETRGFGMFLVSLVSTQEPIGVCGLFQRHDLEDVDLGFALLTKHQGNGYAFEAAKAVLKLATDYNIHTVLAITTIENESSKSLLHRLGFVRDGDYTSFDTSETMLRFKYDLTKSPTST